MTEEERKARASMINTMVTSAVPGISTAIGAFQMIRDQEAILTDEAKHHLQLAIDNLESANLFIMKFTCDMEPGAEGTAKIAKVRDEMEKDVEKFKKEMTTTKGRKIEVE